VGWLSLVPVLWRGLIWVGLGWFGRDSDVNDLCVEMGVWDRWGGDCDGDGDGQRRETMFK